MLGHPALRSLIALKFKGSLRAQVRRLRRPSSWIFLIIGIGIFLIWISTFVLSAVTGHGGRQPAHGPNFLFYSQLSLFVLLTLTVVGAFNHRGLYLPKEEIEGVFAAPLSRSDLIRYRLLVNLLRSLLAGLLFGLVAAMRLPSGAFAFAGTLLAMLTIPIFGQSTALLLGSAENRWSKLAGRMPTRLIAILLSIAFGLLIVFLMIGGQDRFLFEPSPDARMSMESLAHHPLVHTLLLPLSPWALAITAESAREFWPWFGACVLLLFGAYELTARIPVDFRELSLATSADIAKRLNRMRRGGWSAGQAEAGKTALGWNVPWLFGRSPFGAVAWLKLVAIVRKSRGTILFSAFVIALVTLGITSMGRSLDTREELLLGSILVSTIATVYLCTGLRFDFRGDLELMQQVKAWPLAPWRTFLATVLPEVVLVSGLISIALVARMLYLGAFHPLVLVVIALEPLIVLTWVALDNAVFLFMPVRYTPGQEGAFQHIGRSIALLLLRGALFAVVLLVVGGPASLCVVALHKGAQLELDTAIFFGSILGWFLLLGVDAVLVWLGGMMLRRFDVARDRG